MQAGTALVKLMATDVWSGAKRVVVDWWGRHHPEQAEQVGTDLDQLHEEVIDVEFDDETREAYAGSWRIRLRQLIATNPELAEELRQLLTEQLNPMLEAAAGQTTTTISQTATVAGSNNTTTQAGGNITWS
ncbi:hypothetical protein ACFXHA_35245 [Nocardia sp. NPDC059240]|uniref:hypothetical protein n=1 Tax=Nocardia sp. NPDC059240 TaxID=3346786 RepID=UPI0036744BDA